jgi:RNA polymerase sigma-70 factor (ECF subfamily)
MRPGILKPPAHSSRVCRRATASPTKQQAALLLIEVFGWSAAEVAESLDISIASVNSALQRARATLASREISEPAPMFEPQLKLLDRYVDAFHRTT